MTAVSYVDPHTGAGADTLDGLLLAKLALGGHIPDRPVLNDEHGVPILLTAAERARLVALSRIRSCDADPAEMIELRAELDELRDEVADLEAELEATKEEASEMAAERDGLTRGLAEVNARLAAAEARIDELEPLEVGE